MRSVGILLVLLTACDGVIGGMGEDTPSDRPPDWEPTTPGGEALVGGHPDAELGLRRLTGDEYVRSVGTLLGVDLSATLPREAPTYIYERLRESSTISPLHVESWSLAAEAAAEALLSDDAALARALPCNTEILPPRNVTDLQYTAAELGVSSCSHCIRPIEDGAVDVYYGANPGGYTGVFLVENLEAGTYRVTLNASVRDIETLDIRVHLDGEEQTVFAIRGEEPMDYTVDLTVDAGPHRIEFIAPDRLYGIGHIYLYTLQVETLDVQAEAMHGPRQQCLQDFATDLTTRAFRTPAAPEVSAQYLEAATRAWDAGSFWDGLRGVIEAVLISPRFLYLVEPGEATETAGFYTLTPHELAARLALTYWGDLPDEELRRLAADGSLTSPEVLAAQTERVIADPRARQTMRRFYEQWLRLEELESLTRSVEHFPEFDEPTRAGMIEESYSFVDELIWENDGSLADFFLSREQGVPENLAHIYDAPGGSALPDERAGFLTQPAFLALTSAANQTNPVYRGHFVLSRLLCRELHIPQGLNVAAPALDPTATTRERFAAHSSNASCAGCHEAIDPIGFAFEGFDAIGRYRTEEHGLAIDDSGGIPALDVPDGSLAGVRDIAEILAVAPETQMCVARQWFRFAMGRLETDEDSASLDAVRDAIAEGSFRDMVFATAATPAFQHRIETTEVAR